jgi:hypothetical protein
MEAAALAAALAESALESESEEHKAGPWEFTPSHLYGFYGLYLYDPDLGSDDDFDNPHGDWLDFGFNDSDRRGVIGDTLIIDVLALLLLFAVYKRSVPPLTSVAGLMCAYADEINGFHTGNRS